MKGHAEIVGAGLAGLATAIALAQDGWTVRVHEAGPELREFGAGLYVWENGLRVLGALGVLDELRERAHQVPMFDVLDERFRLVQRLSFSGAAVCLLMLCSALQCWVPCCRSAGVHALR